MMRPTGAHACQFYGTVGFTMGKSDPKRARQREKTPAGVVVRLLYPGKQERRVSRIFRSSWVH